MVVLSLFDGCSCGRVALDRAGIQVDKYYASEIDKYAIAVSKKNWPEIVQLGDVKNWRDWDIDFSSVDLVTGGFPCFVAGTKILTSEGYKNIEDVQVGDLCLTHKGQWKPVSNIMQRAKETIEVKAHGSCPTITTNEHPYYVREVYRYGHESKRCWADPKWKAVKDLQKGDYVGIPILKSKENPHKLTEEDCWLLGRYIADGHLVYRKRKNRKNSYHYGVVYSIGEAKLKNFQAAVVNAHLTYHKHTQSTYRGILSSMWFVKLIQELGLGRCAKDKRISKQLLDLPEHLLECVLDGYLSGDGCVRPRDIQSVTTISKWLVMDLVLAVAKVYRTACTVSATKHAPTKIIEGRLVNQSPLVYQLRFQKERRRQSHFVELEGMLWCPFKSATPTNKIETVYNITVDDDHSYIADGRAVHNCQSWSRSGKELGDRDERGELFWVMLDIMQHILKLNPNAYFLMENVKMKKSFEQYITYHTEQALGKVNKHLIDSALVSAQHRERYYWTNIPNIQPPTDQQSKLGDVVLDDAIPVALHNLYGGFNEKSVRVFAEKSPTLRTAAGGGHIPSFALRSMLLKDITLNAGLPIKYASDCVPCELCGEPFCVECQEHYADCKHPGPNDEIGELLLGLELSDKEKAYMDRKIHDGRSHWDFKHHSDLEVGKSATIVANFFKGVPYNVFKDANIIRKFHPIECERLQTLQDNYTEYGIFDGTLKKVSNTQRYKMTGNGWTCNVIAHIFQYMKEDIMSRAGKLKDRKPFDYYQTPPDVIKKFWDAFIENGEHYEKALDPCAGNGVFKDVLSTTNYIDSIVEFDIDPKNDRIKKADFLSDKLTKLIDDGKSPKFDLVISNPPYLLAQEFIEQSIKIAKPTGTVVMLLRLNFLESVKRYDFWQKYKPSEIHVLAKRPSFTGDGGTDGSSYAFFVWRVDELDDNNVYLRVI